MTRPASRLGVLFVLVAVLGALGCGASEEGGRQGPTVTLTSENFEEKVLKNAQPVLVDFWAEWCGPCRQMEPIVKSLAADFEGKATIAQLNVDDAQNIAEIYNISSIPAFVYFKDGRVVGRVVGMTSKRNLAEKLKELLEPAAQ
jgi:thioredoxin